MQRHARLQLVAVGLIVCAAFLLWFQTGQQQQQQQQQQKLARGVPSSLEIPTPTPSSILHALGIVEQVAEQQQQQQHQQQVQQQLQQLQQQQQQLQQQNQQLQMQLQLQQLQLQQQLQLPQEQQQQLQQPPQQQQQQQQLQQPPPQPRQQQQLSSSSEFVYSSDPPYTLYAPRLDIVWSRGWYNAVLPPQGVPIGYYNSRGLTTNGANAFGLYAILGPQTCGTIFLRNCDVDWWAGNVLPKLECDTSIITADGDHDAPTAFSLASNILASPRVKFWYAQNAVEDHPKLVPVPIGISIHDGFPGSPDSVDTAETLRRVANEVKPFAQRERSILFDQGTFNQNGHSRRDTHRRDAAQRLAACNRVAAMPHLPRVKCWEKYAAHQFAISVTGEGWDTHRLWEYLYLGTVPIVKSGPLDRLLREGRVPVVIVSDWSEVCQWTDGQYAALAAQYESWISRSREWLYPWHWVPRNQTALDALCLSSPACKQAHNL